MTKGKGMKKSYWSRAAKKRRLGKVLIGSSTRERGKERGGRSLGCEVQDKIEEIGRI